MGQEPLPYKILICIHTKLVKVLFEIMFSLYSRVWVPVKGKTNVEFLQNSASTGTVDMHHWLNPSNYLIMSLNSASTGKVDMHHWLNPSNYLIMSLNSASTGKVYMHHWLNPSNYLIMSLIIDLFFFF